MENCATFAGLEFCLAQVEILKYRKGSKFLIKVKAKFSAKMVIKKWPINFQELQVSSELFEIICFYSELLYYTVTFDAHSIHLSQNDDQLEF